MEKKNQKLLTREKEACSDVRNKFINTNVTIRATLSHKTIVTK